MGMNWLNFVEEFPYPSLPTSMFTQLDHIAIIVSKTEEALAFYRDRLGLAVLLSEELPEVGVRLTHLDLGPVELQLVEPLHRIIPCTNIFRPMVKAYIICVGASKRWRKP